MSVDDILYAKISKPCYLCGSVPAVPKANGKLPVCQPCQTIIDKTIDEFLKVRLGEGA